jgi:orotate phosphoribosyltransferase
MTAHAILAKKVLEASHLQGNFRLRSGATSTEYFDKYRLEAQPLLLKEVSEQLAERLPKIFDALAGLEMGGIPIATMLSQITGKPTLFVRKKAKEYGTCRFAEGGEISGRHLLIVEDVVTSGGQIIESVRALRNDGAIISDVVCVIDRQAGGRENLEKEGLTLVSLFSKNDLLR